MKKACCCLLGLFLLLCLPLPGCAESTSYYLGDIGLSFTMPEGYDVFTPDNYFFRQTLLDEYGYTTEEMEEIFADGTIPFFAFRQSDGAILYLYTVKEENVLSSDSLSSSTNAQIDSMIVDLNRQGMGDFHCVRQNFGENKFLFFTFGQDIIVEAFYSTVHQGRRYDFTMVPYYLEDSLSPKDLEDLDLWVQSVDFFTPVAAPSPTVSSLFTPSAETPPSHRSSSASFPILAILPLLVFGVCAAVILCYGLRQRKKLERERQALESLLAEMKADCESSETPSEDPASGQAPSPRLDADSDQHPLPPAP